MKRLLKPLIYGIVACAVAWALALSTSSFGPCNPDGPFAWLFMLLILPSMLLGLKGGFLIIVFGSIPFVLISGVLFDVTFRVIGKLRARFRAISLGKNRMR
jgi:hypothetical protein